jgi:predicted AAA+ superfamily ATPase
MMDVGSIYAFRWVSNKIEPIEHPDFVKKNELLEIDNQKSQAMRNIELFLSNEPALNMLLWGERGCGKSSLIKMLLYVYKDSGLRVVELYQENIENIYNLYRQLRHYPQYKFMLFFDDISFDHKDVRYRKFKSILEGGIEKSPKNVIFAATSNKRHLIKDEVLKTDDLYSHDEINEQMSLFGRFGLILGFYPLSKTQYLSICEYYMEKYKVEKYKNWEKDAENYAMARGGRSGRIAKQFAIFKLL